MTASSSAEPAAGRCGGEEPPWSPAGLSRVRRRCVLTAGVLGLAIAVSGCGAADSGGGEGVAAGKGVITQIPVADREPLPAITGATLDGGRYDSSDHAGKIIVYNVWGSWCAPCRKEAPVLQKVWRETREEGVVFIGLNTRDNDAAARAFEQSFQIGYPSVTSDDTASVLLQFGSFLPRSAVPSTVVVDRSGRVAARVIGEISYATLAGLVEDVLAEPAA